MEKEKTFQELCEEAHQKYLLDEKSKTLPVTVDSTLQRFPEVQGILKFRNGLSIYMNQHSAREALHLCNPFQSIH